MTDHVLLLKLFLDLFVFIALSIINFAFCHCLKVPDAPSFKQADQIRYDICMTNEWPLLTIMIGYACLIFWPNNSHEIFWIFGSIFFASLVAAILGFYSVRTFSRQKTNFSNSKT